MTLATMNRRRFLFQGSSMALALTAMPRISMAEERLPLEVACAGSMRAMVEGPLKLAAARTLGLDLRAHAMGADAVAKALVEGSLLADVFLPITATPMLTVLRAGKAESAVPIAQTEMVIVYSPKSRFAARFAAAAKGEANWWEVLQEPGLRFSRSDPRADPGGRNIIFTMMLAAKKYKQPDLVAKVLGAPLNPEQIPTTGNSQAMLQSGELDAMGSYRISALASHASFLTLPADVNLGGLSVHDEHPDIQLTLGEKTFYPDPLVFYAAALKNAPNPRGADALITWLRSSEVQALFRDNGFAPAGAAAELHA